VIEFLQWDRHAPLCKEFVQGGLHARITTVRHCIGMVGFSYKGKLGFDSLVHQADGAKGFEFKTKDKQCLSWSQGKGGSFEQFGVVSG